MMSPHPLSIAATMVAGFVVTTGVILWQRHAGDLRLPGPQTAVPTAAGRPMERRSPPPAPVAAAVEAVRPARAALAASTPPGPEVAEVRAIGRTVQEEVPIVPVNVTFLRRGKALPSIRTRIINAATDPLTISIRIESAEGSSAKNVQVQVAALGPTEFSAADGLDLKSGDRLTLHSPPYADLVTSVD